MASKRPCEILSSDSETDEDVESSGETPDSRTPRLTAPVKAKISRPRKMSCNPGRSMNSERAQCVNKSTNIKKKSLWDRAKEFKGEKLTVREGKLYCEPCSEILSSKKSIVAGHCKSLKHKKSQETFAKTKLRSQSLAEVLRKRDKTTHAVGESLPMEMRVWRLQVVQGFLAAGVPIAKIDPLRHLLESNNHRLTTRSNLSQIVPVVLQEEIRLVKDELRQPGTQLKVHTRQGSSP